MNQSKFRNLSFLTSTLHLSASAKSTKHNALITINVDRKFDFLSQGFYRDKISRDELKQRMCRSNNELFLGKTFFWRSW